MCFCNGWSINYTSQKLHIENVFECAFNRIIFVTFVKQNYGYFFLKLCVGLITGMVGLLLFFRESHHGALYFTSNGDTSFITSILIRAPLAIGSRYWLPIGPLFCRRIRSSQTV
jgi:hypothetical protein